MLGALPSPDRLVIERFKDPNGDRHLVLHSFAGARINRAWGLALRKRFCRQFNFELQAAATDDGVLISLGVTSEFEPEAVVRFVRSTTARDVLTQALLDTPLFLTRFRWAANTALLLPRIDLCGPVSAQQQRSRTENLIACVFPDQLACLENLSGPREVPDHPLVRQALDDCLNDHMDVEGLIELLGEIETGRMHVHAVDLDQPSPLAEGLIHAPRHSFLDEAAAEERRTRSFERVPGRRSPKPGPSSTAAPRAVPSRPRVEPARVVVAPPSTTRSTLALPRTAEALSRLLQSAGFLTAREGERGFGLANEAAGGWSGPFATLVRARRAVSLGKWHPAGRGRGLGSGRAVSFGPGCGRSCRPRPGCRPISARTVRSSLNASCVLGDEDWAWRGPISAPETMPRRRHRSIRNRSPRRARLDGPAGRIRYNTAFARCSGRHARGPEQQRDPDYREER
jgi:ATP-dependent Lhr-like helicase